MDDITLKRFRSYRGLTQEEVAEMLNITAATYKYKEKNPERFKVSEAKKIREALKMSEEDSNKIFFAI